MHCIATTRCYIDYLNAVLTDGRWLLCNNYCMVEIYWEVIELLTYHFLSMLTFFYL